MILRVTFVFSLIASVFSLGAALSVMLIVITMLLIFIYTRFAKIEDMEVV